MLPKVGEVWRYAVGEDWAEWEITAIKPFEGKTQSSDLSPYGVMVMGSIINAPFEIDGMVNATNMHSSGMTDWTCLKASNTLSCAECNAQVVSDYLCKDCRD